MIGWKIHNEDVWTLLKNVDFFICHVSFQGCTTKRDEIKFIKILIYGVYKENDKNASTYFMSMNVDMWGIFEWNFTLFMCCTWRLTAVQPI